jgi:small GTP-binding protein
VTAVLQKKVCMLGAVGVGKTSLVRRFVESIFSDRYLATVGVKIDRKSLTVGATELNLMLWDLQGEAAHQETRMEYLRGAGGCLLVVDATRASTLDNALSLGQRAAAIAPAAPLVLVVNKVDLAEQLEVSDALLEPLRTRGWPILRTSARSGLGVEEAFRGLAERMLAITAPLAEER